VTIRQRSPAKPVEKWDAMRYRHNITVLVDGKHRIFPWYGRVVDYQNERDMIAKGDLIDVLKCAVDDACFVLAGNIRNPDVIKECMDSKRRLNELGFSDDDMYEIEEELRGR
jgi:hypothetical protein